jgi:adenylylsulfate kinase-like enzyme
MTAAAEPGYVFWITGLPAAGKTSIGRLLFASLRVSYPNSVFLDGDVLRGVFEHDLGYTIEDRRRCARRYARLGAMLAAQGLHVVVATVSMFEDVRRWNRQSLARYLEVYVRAPLELRRGRDPETYAGRDVPGVDLEMEVPSDPHLVVDNDGSTSLAAIVATICRRAGMTRR